MNGPLILVVEDELVVARDIIRQLQDFGYTVVGPATTGAQAIEMAQQWRPQLVLMDVHLTGSMDGIAAAQAIRSQFGILSVFLSAFDSADSLQRAKLTEPAGYLIKPFLEYQLREVLVSAFTEHIS